MRSSFADREIGARPNATYILGHRLSSSLILAAPHLDCNVSGLAEKQTAVKLHQRHATAMSYYILSPNLARMTGC